MPRRLRKSSAGTLLILSGIIATNGCVCAGPPGGPTDVVLGETTLIVVVNPVINADNQVSVPSPGPVREGVLISLEGGPSVTTDEHGIAVLSPVPSGTRVLEFSGAGVTGELSVTMTAKDLREIAVASTSEGMQLMAEINYPFGGEVLELTPDASATEVNAALARSNTIVLVRGGTYAGDVSFGGSNVTLFGEGARGGMVEINGDVQVAGSTNRIRGARINGRLDVPGSNFSLTFSSVDGGTTIAGSAGTLLMDSLCGSVSIGGSGTTILGTRGLPPMDGGC